MAIMMEYYQNQIKRIENMGNLELTADKIQEMAMNIMAQEGYFMLFKDPKLEAFVIECNLLLTGVATATESAVREGDHVSPQKLEPSYRLFVDLFERFIKSIRE